MCAPRCNLFQEQCIQAGMADSVHMRAPAHYLRVDLEDPAEAEYWLVVLDCDRARAEAAIAAVGRDAQDVRTWLDQRA
jgi:hypothetical protein